MRKRVLSWLGSFLILAGTLLPGVSALAEQTAVPTTTGTWSLTSSGPEYSGGKTTWTYTISSTGRPEAMDQMDLVLCSSFDADNVSASNGGSVGADGELGLSRAVIWSSLRGPTTVRVTYDGLWADGSQSWYIQAGNDLFHGTVDGPSCSALTPNFQITKTVSADANSGGGSSLTLTGGGTVYYRYTITNTGNTRLTIDSATDDKLGSVSFPGGDLAPGDQVTATTSKTFPELAPGSPPQTEENTVTATASFAGETVGPKAASATVVNEPRPGQPSFTVQKKVSATNNKNSAAGSLTLPGGGTAYYFYTVTNTGEVPLSIDSAVDDKLGALSFSSAVIAPGDSAEATASKSFPALQPGSEPEQEINTVTVTVSHDEVELPSKTDSATVVNMPPVAHKGFTVTKKVSDTNDAATGADSLTLTGGGTAYYFYTVTNTGDLSLTIVSATDDVLGPISFPNTTLAPGESVTATRSKQFDALTPGSGTVWETNTITVQAESPDRTTLTESDQATVGNQAVAANPDFTLTKRVSKTNAPGSASDSITLTGGGTAYYFYTVTNTGNVPLTIIEATDDKLGSLSFTPTEIPVGGTATATASKTFPALAKGTPDQTEVNTAVVSVTHQVDTAPLSKSAQASVTNKAKTGGGGGGGGTPTPTPKTSFTVEKAASTVNDPATGQSLVTLTGGGTVYYFYTVTNTGETTITIETATDDKLGALTFSPATIEPGEAATAQAEKVFSSLPVGAATQSETNLVSVSIRNERGLLYGPLKAQATVTNQAEAARVDFTVTKRVSATDDPATGKAHLTMPATGGTAYYFYTVTNTGNVPLTIAEAVDDKLGAVSLTPATIAPGATATGVLSKEFGPNDAGRTETNRFTVTTTHGGKVYGPQTDSVSVQLAALMVGSLQVRVLDGSARNNGINPVIPGAVVTLSNGMHGVTDASGRILFTNLPFAEYEAAAASFDPQNPTASELRTGSGVATLTPSNPDEMITIFLAWESSSTPPTPRAPQISVAVCQTFTPMGGEVLATGPDGATVKGEIQADGTYLLKDLAAGQWTVTMTAPDLQEPVTRTLYLRSDNDMPHNAYSLDLSGVCPAATGAVIGRICSPKRPGAEIVGAGPQGQTATVTIPSNGRLGEWREYRLDNLAEGEWTLTLTAPGDEPVSQTVAIKAREVTRANDFSLACTGQSGLDLAGAWYYLTGGLMIAGGIVLRRWARVV